MLDRVVAVAAFDGGKSASVGPVVRMTSSPAEPARVSIPEITAPEETSIVPPSEKASVSAPAPPTIWSPAPNVPAATTRVSAASVPIARSSPAVRALPPVGTNER